AVGAGHVVDQHAGRRRHAEQAAFGDVAGVGIGRRHVVDDVDGDGPGAGVAVGVGDLVGEALGGLGVGAVVGVGRGVERLCLRVDIAAVVIDLDGAIGAGGRGVAAADQLVVQRADAARAVELVGCIGLGGQGRQRAGDGAGGEIGAALDQVEGCLV